MFETGIGILASVITSLCMIPQLIKIIKSRSAEQVSMAMIVTLLIGLLLWTYYGVLKKDIILMVANIMSIIINLTTLIFVLKYRNAR
jgi:MtN3 and saliva related transmembrane protein